MATVELPSWLADEQRYEPTGDYLQTYSEEQGLGFAGQAAMYILSGVIGVAVLTIAFRLVSLTVKESGAHGNSRAA